MLRAQDYERNVLHVEISAVVYLRSSQFDDPSQLSSADEDRILASIDKRLFASLLQSFKNISFRRIIGELEAESMGLAYFDEINVMAKSELDNVLIIEFSCDSDLSELWLGIWDLIDLDCESARDHDVAKDELRELFESRLSPDIEITRFTCRKLEHD